MIEEHEPILVSFPLTGEWLSPNTPGSKIPSHGTNQLGTRYAYDFIQVDWERNGLPAYRVYVEGKWRKVVNGVPTAKDRIRNVSW